MAAVIPIKVRCPRCGKTIELSVQYGVRLVQTSPGSKSFITADVSASGIEHTCPDSRGN